MGKVKATLIQICLKYIDSINVTRNLIKIIYISMRLYGS